jgi:UDPglucose--hexose-1-phosphate uridylyltransferase
VVFRKSSESPIDCHSLDTEVICENSDWQVVVITTIKQPAFCTLLLPKQPWHSMSTLGDDEIASLANIISIISTRYDNLMMTYVDLTIDWYSTDDTPDTLHAIISPAPSTVDGMFGSQRFIVGDFTPEQTARRLRNLSDIHFRDIFSR